ncbi:hypothetical protein DM01DRAFT_1338668 [Hesseltinella vesiculosa]|uniref:BZIP domain-containing protein n=1 Tax=Hesseltinella vesiculosa TaxID=101127 RepID=A0A1X2G8Z6_9FUNG|nr:hypothetical protein DM01DRAFT_1338668 [Hesseltinella vesiculosa]
MMDMDVDVNGMAQMDFSSPNYDGMPEQPTKIRKKPGRKPNPASPALRKAQNRAAQRAFRERKEKHLKELEVTVKQMREQRDKLYLENEQLKADGEIAKSENWYLKGIVLTLQLVCFQHKLAIPIHSPFITDEALSVMAQTTPEPIAAYLDVNANSKAPQPTRLSGYRHTLKQRDRYFSQGAIIVTKDDVSMTSAVPPMPSLQPTKPTPPVHNPIELMHPLQMTNSPSAPPVSPYSTSSVSMDHKDLQNDSPNQSIYPADNTLLPPLPTIPIPPANEPVTSNLAAIQTLRLRLRLQSCAARLDSVPFSIQPTVLQLTIPHDPRIDLIPTPHMRDRMIIFREQFDLDDCFRCLLSGSVFHGGDPAAAGNWQLPKIFFEKYWFLTIDYTLRRTTNRWRKLQGLHELESDLSASEDDFTMMSDIEDRQSMASKSSTDLAMESLPALEQPSDFPNANGRPGASHLPQPLDGSSLSLSDLSAYLGVEFSKLEQIQREQHAQMNADAPQHPLNTSPMQPEVGSISFCPPVESFFPPPSSSSVLFGASENGSPEFEPVRLTNGYYDMTPSTTATSPPAINSASPWIDPASTPNSSSDYDPAGGMSSQHTIVPVNSNENSTWNKFYDDSNTASYDAFVNNLLSQD